MSYEVSPKLDDFNKGIPKTLPDPDNSKRNLRFLIGLLTMIMMLLVMINPDQSGNISHFASSKGAVTGKVLDGDGNPQIADIFILGTGIQEKSSTNGVFEVTNIPKGLRSVVIVDDEGGLEYKVEIKPGEKINLGIIHLKSTPTPEE
jgi:hypothetical protein